MRRAEHLCMPVAARIAIIVVGFVVVWFTPPVQKKLALIQVNAALEAVEQGQLDAAAALSSRAQATAQAHGWTDVSGRAAWAATLVATKRGQWDVAAVECQRAMADGGAQGRSADLQFTLGAIQLNQGHPKDAVQTLERGLALLQSRRQSPSSEQLSLYASALEASGRKDDARKVRAQAPPPDDDTI